MSPRVSLGIPVFNGEKFLSQAIQSVLDQDFRDFEIIVADNASTDGTAEICRRFMANDGRIRYHRNETNLGAGPNFNLTFERSSGDFFKWCAADDFISPNFLSACLEEFEANPDAALVFGTARSVDEDGREIPLERSVISEKLDPRPDRRFGSVVNEVNACTEVFGLFRSDVLRKTMLHKGYYGSDRALIAETCLLGTIRHRPEAIFYNRDHPDRSVNLSIEARALWQNSAGGFRSPKEYWALLIQLVTIAIRHRDRVPLRRTLRVLLAWAATPLHLARATVELIGLLSPAAYEWVKKTGWSVVGLIQSRRSLRR